MEEGKVFLGWKDSISGKLYKANENVVVKANMSLEAVAFTFNMFGASLRIDSVGDTSGLRFITNYNAAEYEEIRARVVELGTIIVKTSSLEDKDFVIENFTVGTDLAKIVNTKDHFETADGMAYSAALTNLKATNIDKSFSARGYIKVVYHDESTAYIYTDYSAEDNSRSAKSVAQALKVYLDGAYYNSLDVAMQAVIDGYAD